MWDQFIFPAAQQARQSISATASKHKRVAVLIASRLPHEPADRGTAIMESVGTVETLLRLSVRHQYCNSLVLKTGNTCLGRNSSPPRPAD